MMITLRNCEETTKIIEELKNKNFARLDIDTTPLLTFIEIEDNKFNSYVMRNNSNLDKFVIVIYKRFEYKTSIEIPLELVQTIDELGC